MASGTPANRLTFRAPAVLAGGQGRHGAVGAGGGQLADGLGPAVPGREDAGHRRGAVLPGGDEARPVHGDPRDWARPLSGSWPTAWNRADDRQMGDVPVAVFRSVRPVRRSVPSSASTTVEGSRVRLARLRGLLHQDGVRPEVRPPVDQRHMAAEVRQIQGVLEGGVAAAGHGRVLPGVKGPVAHGAEGDPARRPPPGQAQGPAAHPGGQDHRPGR